MKWTSDSKRVPAKKQCIGNTTNNASMGKPEESEISETSLTPSTSSLPLFLSCSMASSLIGSDIKLAKKKINFLRTI